MKIENVLAWCVNTERACQNLYATATAIESGYLRDAIAIIRQQHDEIQKARNDLIAATATEKDDLK